jgi:hypothetical protein
MTVEMGGKRQDHGDVGEDHASRLSTRRDHAVEHIALDVIATWQKA